MSPALKVVEKKEEQKKNLNQKEAKNHANLKKVKNQEKEKNHVKEEEQKGINNGVLSPYDAY